MLNMTTSEDSISTGVKEIAGVLGGGIREDSLLLIEGESKSGKSVLSQHIAYGTLRSNNDAVAYYIVDTSAEDMIAQMNSMSLDVMHDFTTDRLRFYTVGSTNVFEEALKSLQMLTNHIAKLPERFSLVVLDSVSPFMTRIDPTTKIDFLIACKELCTQNRSIILVVNTHIFEGKTLSRAYAISDYYLNLKSKDVILAPGQVDCRSIKILSVTKLGGAERHTGEDVRFEIKPKIGIQILPFVKVRV